MHALRMRSRRKHRFYHMKETNREKCVAHDHFYKDIRGFIENCRPTTDDRTTLGKRKRVQAVKIIDMQLTQELLKLHQDYAESSAANASDAE